ncbi:uncharacterized protein LOC131698720 [Acipenser ruthenus]|uniref:uncharacterized protein LOC131698720 n=1 Tax=Acipenser ruthenus TaxID=7906 RepID=UPI0027410000|nr:uncharacterized protein LOC131698720 [Acipenser ruthenus]
MASRGCKHPADAFCYVCGQFIKTRAKKYSVEASAKMCEAYKAYFGMPVGDQDKPWAPHFTCEHCKKTLEGWYRGEKRAMKFAIPRIWREPTDHSSNCYFCMVDPSKRRTGKNALAITYPDLPSSIVPGEEWAAQASQDQIPRGRPQKRELPAAATKRESSWDAILRAVMHDCWCPICGAGSAGGQWSFFWGDSESHFPCLESVVKPFHPLREIQLRGNAY